MMENGLEIAPDALHLPRSRVENSYGIRPAHRERDLAARAGSAKRPGRQRDAAALKISLDNRATVVTSNLLEVYLESGFWWGCVCTCSVYSLKVSTLSLDSSCRVSPVAPYFTSNLSKHTRGDQVVVKIARVIT